MNINPYIASEQESDGIDSLEKMRHSCAHVLAMAVTELYPSAKLGIGPALPNGFYYDFEIKKELTNEDLIKIEEKMYEIKERELTYNQYFVTRDEAIDMLNLSGQVFKAELVNDIDDEEISFFATGEKFKDLCRGPHMKHTGEVGVFNLTRVEKIHWRNDPNRPVMQRIFGIAFPTKDQLDQYLLEQKEVENRDHMKIGNKLSYYSKDDDNEGILWYPKGSFVLNQMKDRLSDLEVDYGFINVKTPLFKSKKVNTKKRTEQEISYEMKINKAKDHRLIKKKLYNGDSVVRLSETYPGFSLYDEDVLNGLKITRNYDIYEVNIFTASDYVISELQNLYSYISAIYNLFKLGDIYVRLAMGGRDPKDIAYDSELKNIKEETFKKFLEEEKIDYSEVYGDSYPDEPTLYIAVRDLFDSEMIMSKISFPMLNLVSENQIADAQITAQCLTSIERAFAIYFENSLGVLPLWSSPVQVVVVSNSIANKQFAENVVEQLNNADIRVALDDRDESPETMIQQAQDQKIPYILFIEDKESKSNAVSVKTRDGKDLGMMTISEFIERIEKEATDSLNVTQS